MFGFGDWRQGLVGIGGGVGANKNPSPELVEPKATKGERRFSDVALHCETPFDKLRAAVL